VNNESQAQAVQVVEQAPQRNTLMGIIRAVVERPEVDVSKVESLVRLQQDQERIDARVEFMRQRKLMALRMPRVKKNGTISLVKNGENKGSIPFAKWEDVDAIVRPILAEHGFSISFRTRVEGGQLIMAAVLAHELGHEEISECPVKSDAGPGRNSTQAEGSGRSYMKRYLTLDMLNIVTEGQDNNGRTADPITKDQADNIQTLVNDLKRDKRWISRFLIWAEAPSVALIQQGHYARVIDYLQSEANK
jgi:hypothetical protein